VVETVFGYHIIKCEELRGNEVRVRHILIALATTEADEKKTFDHLLELRQRALSGEDFSALVEEYSQDSFTKDVGGDLGWFPVDQLTQPFRDVVNTMNINDISEPIKTGSGYHLLRMIDRVNQRQITLDDDWDALEDLARQKKISDKLQSWLDELRQEIYVDIRLEG
jgi:peptidyl-prolyl cis-trans isomerase SurA